MIFYFSRCRKLTEERPSVSLHYNFVEQLEKLEKERKMREERGEISINKNSEALSLFNDWDDDVDEILLGGHTQPDFDLSEKLGCLVPLLKHR
jgi:hypothetical protein